MRTVVFIGLLCIAVSIGSQTGWELSEKANDFCGYIFIFAALIDIVYLFKYLSR